MDKGKITPQRPSSQGSARKQSQRLPSDDQVAALNAAIRAFVEELQKNTKGAQPIKAPKSLNALRERLKFFRLKGFPVSPDQLVEILDIIDIENNNLCKRCEPLVFTAIGEALLQADASREAERGMYLLADSLFTGGDNPSNQGKLEDRKTHIGADLLIPLVRYLIDSEKHHTMRRWVGILCGQLMKDSPNNYDALELGPDDLKSQIGLRMLEEDDELSRIIFGQLIRDLLSGGGLDLPTLFPDGYDATLYDDFPPSTQENRGWTIQFDEYMDRVLPLVGTDVIDQLYHGWAFSLSPNVRFGVPDKNVQILVRDDDLTFMATASPTRMNQLLDVPLDSIHRLTIKSPPSSQGNAVDVMIELDQKGLCFLGGKEIRLKYLYFTGRQDNVDKLADRLSKDCKSLLSSRENGMAVKYSQSQEAIEVQTGGPYLDEAETGSTNSDEGENEEYENPQNSGEPEEGPLVIDRMGAEDVDEDEGEDEFTDAEDVSRRVGLESDVVSTDFEDESPSQTRRQRMGQFEAKPVAKALVKDPPKAVKPTVIKPVHKFADLLKKGVRPKAKPPIELPKLSHAHATAVHVDSIPQVKDLGEQPLPDGKSGSTIVSKQVATSKVSVKATRKIRVKPKPRSKNKTTVLSDDDDEVTSPGVLDDPPFVKVNNSKAQLEAKLPAKTQAKVEAAAVVVTAPKNPKRFSLHAVKLVESPPSVHQAKAVFDLPTDGEEDIDAKKKGTKPKAKPKPKPKKPKSRKSAEATEVKPSAPNTKKKRQSAPAALQSNVGIRQSQRGAAAQANAKMKGADAPSDELEDDEETQLPPPQKVAKVAASSKPKLQRKPPTKAFKSEEKVQDSDASDDAEQAVEETAKDVKQAAILPATAANPAPKTASNSKAQLSPKHKVATLESNDCIEHNVEIENMEMADEISAPVVDPRNTRVLRSNLLEKELASKKAARREALPHIELEALDEDMNVQPDCTQLLEDATPMIHEEENENVLAELCPTPKPNSHTDAGKKASKTYPNLQKPKLDWAASIGSMLDDEPAAKPEANLDNFSSGKKPSRGLEDHNVHSLVEPTLVPAQESLQIPAQTLAITAESAVHVPSPAAMRKKRKSAEDDQEFAKKRRNIQTEEVKSVPLLSLAPVQPEVKKIGGTGAALRPSVSAAETQPESARPRPAAFDSVKDLKPIAITQTPTPKKITNMGPPPPSVTHTNSISASELVDEYLQRKPHVISFGVDGPRNQGLPSAHKSSERRVVQPTLSATKLPIPLPGSADLKRKRDLLTSGVESIMAEPQKKKHSSSPPEIDENEQDRMNVQERIESSSPPQRYVESEHEDEEAGFNIPSSPPPQAASPIIVPNPVLAAPTRPTLRQSSSSRVNHNGSPQPSPSVAVVDLMGQLKQRLSQEIHVSKSHSEKSSEDDLVEHRTTMLEPKVRISSLTKALPSSPSDSGDRRYVAHNEFEDGQYHSLLTKGVIKEQAQMVDPFSAEKPGRKSSTFMERLQTRDVPKSSRLQFQQEVHVEIDNENSTEPRLPRSAQTLKKLSGRERRDGLGNEDIVVNSMHQDSIPRRSLGFKNEDFQSIQIDARRQPKASAPGTVTRDFKAAKQAKMPSDVRSMGERTQPLLLSRDISRDNSRRVSTEDEDRTLVNESRGRHNPSSPSSSESSFNSREDSRTSRENKINDNANERWNSAVRPHLRGVSDALHRVVDETLIHLSDTEDAMGLLIKDYEKKSGKILANFESTHEKDTSRVQETLQDKNDEVTKAYKSANDMVSGMAKDSREDSVVGFEAEWKKSQTSTQELIAKGLSKSL